MQGAQAGAGRESAEALRVQGAGVERWRETTENTAGGRSGQALEEDRGVYRMLKDIKEMGELPARYHK